MARSADFGWSYPPGCSGPPDDWDPWQELFRCGCGAFLPLKSANRQEVVELRNCPGDPEDPDFGFCLTGREGADPHEAHEVEWGSVVELSFTCNRCSKESKRIEH